MRSFLICKPISVNKGLSGMNEPTILYDGYCNLCNFSTRLILRFDRKRIFHYFPLQSPEGQKLLSNVETKPDTVILYFNNILFIKSDAVLKTASLLGFPVNILTVFRIVPKSVRDFLYDIIAKYRYKLFGKKDYCKMGPENEKRRPPFWSPLKNIRNQ